MTYEQIVLIKTLFNVTIGDINSDLLNQKNIGALLIHSKLQAECINALSSNCYIGIRACNTDYCKSILTDKEKCFEIKGIPSVAATSVAEHIMMFIYSLAKNIQFYNQQVKTGEWQNNRVFNRDILGSILTIIGYGNVAKELENIALKNGMSVNIITRSTTEEKIASYLKKSDFVSLNISNETENRKYFNKQRFSMMRRGSFFINTSRGDLVDEHELMERLRTGFLAGAALDVFEEGPAKLRSLTMVDNLITSPHIAFYTQSTIEKMNSEMLNLLFSHFNTSIK